jgi:hypothetical protein
MRRDGIFLTDSYSIHRNDFLRRRKVYLSDWTDAAKKKRLVIPAVLFLYFACLAPAVSFGTIASEITNGSMGVVEFLLGSGVAGMVSCFFGKFDFHRTWADS